MRRLFNFKGIIICLIAFDILALGRTGFLTVANEIPNEMMMFQDKETEYEFSAPIEVDFNNDCKEVFEINGNNNLDVKPSKNMTISANKEGSYEAEVKLFGFINLKNIDINIVKPVEVYPIGKCAGIYVETDGLMVIGCGDMDVDGIIEDSPCENILKAGDYILKINGSEIRTSMEFSDAVNEADDDKIVITIRRDNEVFDVAVNRVKYKDDEYKIGLWIRENLQGIGTVTYVDKNGDFGALGHSISDSSSGELLEIKSGKMYVPIIRDIIKGKQRNPGEIYGTISYDDKDYLGSIDENSPNGIFGKLRPNMVDYVTSGCELTQIKLKNEIHEGDASIICNVDNERKEYDIQITDVNINSDDNKSMIIEITDEELLACTNGVVQGMSGSPIIQDGKFIGAVTHVFVNDPTRGYGIFAENMMEQG